MAKHTMNNAVRACLLALVALSLPIGCARPSASPPPLAGARIGGPFTLIDQDGKPFDSRRLAGRYAIFYFGYTFCPDVCPTDMLAIGKALRELDRSEPALADKVQPVFVTVDPARDTPEVVKQFVGSFHPRFIGLTGSEAEIDRVAKLYAASYQRHAPVPGTTGYLVDHMRAVYLFGPDGKPIALLPADEGADAVVAELRKWVR
jgi:protein SCO1